MSNCLIKHCTMQTYGRVEVWLHVFVFSALDANEWSSSCLGGFMSVEEPQYSLNWRLG
jgi:hypothetical protein